MKDNVLEFAKFLIPELNKDGLVIAHSTMVNLSPLSKSIDKLFNQNTDKVSFQEASRDIRPTDVFDEKGELFRPNQNLRQRLLGQ